MQGRSKDFSFIGPYLKQVEPNKTSVNACPAKIRPPPDNGHHRYGSKDFSFIGPYLKQAKPNKTSINAAHTKIVPQRADGSG